MTENLASLLRKYTAYPDDIGRASIPVELLREAADLLERQQTPPKEESGQKMRIYVNRHLDKIWSPNKRAAHAVHAALQAVGAHTGQRVVVLDKGSTMIREMRTHIYDAGHTELEPNTLTAGTNWPDDSEM